LTLRGPVYGKDKSLIFDDSDVFLHPSRFEEMAKLVREATAAGLPVIASRDSNYGDWASEGGFGRVTSLSPDALAQEMAWFLDHKDQLSALSTKAIQFAHTHTWAWVARRLSDVYESNLRSFTASKRS
jgi:glycosyltransferase involved in cell wall biosynthesis